MNVRVEYEATPIRHIAVQCDKCGSWFNGLDVTESVLTHAHHILFARFHCPVCDCAFGFDGNYDAFLGAHNVQIQECDSSEEVYKDCKRKKTTWE